MKKLLSLMLMLTLLLSCFPSDVVAEGDKYITLNFWGFGTEWTEHHDHFLKTHPDSKIRFNMISKSWNDYQMALDIALASGGGADYPDVFCAEVDFVEKYVNSDFSMPLADLGVDVDWETKLDEYKIAPYSIGVGKTVDSGVLKGIASQFTGLITIYRASWAEQVLGTSDPEEIYKYTKDIDSFIATCKLIEEKAGNEFNAISSINEITSFYYANMKNKFIENGKLMIDEAMLRYTLDVKNLVERDMCTDTNMFTEAWYADLNDMNEKKIVLYSGAPWKFNAHIKNVAVQSYGDWRATQAPTAGFEGGTWLLVGKDVDPAKYDAIKEYFNFWAFDSTEAGLGTHLTNAGDCPISAVTAAKLSEGFHNELCGGQNTLELYVKIMPTISEDNPAVIHWDRYTARCMSRWESLTSNFIDGDLGSLEEMVEMYIEEITSIIDCEPEENWRDKVRNFEDSYVF